jgi:hypothetical protein
MFFKEQNEQDRIVLEQHYENVADRMIKIQQIRRERANKANNKK